MRVVTLAACLALMASPSLRAQARPCRSGWPSLSAVDRTMMQAEVQAALDSLTDGWRRIDTTEILHFYLDSARLAHNGRLGGMADLRAAWVRLGPRLQRQDIEPFQQVAFDVLSCDVVVVNWVNQWTFIFADGHVVGPRTSANTYVWVRRGTAWRIQSAHESILNAPNAAR
jgi:SnoaL-like domain